MMENVSAAPARHAVDRVERHGVWLEDRRAALLVESDELAPHPVAHVGNALRASPCRDVATNGISAHAVHTPAMNI